MLRLVSKGAIEPGPPTSSQVVGWMVEVIRSIRLSKSACVPPPSPPGPGLLTRPAATLAFGLALETWAISAGLIMPLWLPPSLLATTAKGAALPPEKPPPWLKPALLMALCKAPSRPALGLGTKLGIGITRSATL